MDHQNCTRVQAPAQTVPENPDVSQRTHHDVISNPAGRITSDIGDGGTSKNFINRKNFRKSNILISTLNTRTIARDSRKLELTHGASAFSADVICLQEHRIYHKEEELLIEKLDNYHLITSSATKNNSNTSVGGVGILLSTAAFKACINTEKICDRIMVKLARRNSRSKSKQRI